MSLPAEIVSHIFSFLRYEPAALAACSESHPSLFQLARPYFFSHIFFKTDDSSVECFKPADLTEILSRHPYIAHYICTLEIYVGGGSDSEIQRHRLEEISTILPNLSALREISLDHSRSLLVWEGLPKSFRLAFLDCLRSQSMREVCIDGVLHFPFKSALNGECKSIRSLTVRGVFWVHPSRDNLDLDLDLDGPPTNQGLALESLCLKCTGIFLQGLAPWFEACRSQLRSLEFECLYGNDGYDLLPMLLASCSNSLTSLSLDLGLKNYYDFDMPSIGHGATETIPVTLSTLPHLEQLTIHAALQYSDHTPIGRLNIWGFYSPIPAITQLFSSPDTPSFKCLNLNFFFTIQSQSSIQTKSLPWSLLSGVICTPLVHLLSTISALECSGSSSAISIRVNLRLREAFTTKPPLRIDRFPRAIPLNVIHSFLSGSKELMQFVEQGRLVITPPVPTSLNINVVDYW